MSVLLQLPKPIARLLAVHGGDAELVQLKQADGSVRRMLHVLDETERYARVAQSERAKQHKSEGGDGVAAKAPADASNDVAYLEALKKARTVLRQDAVLGPILGSDDASVWPTLHDIVDLVDLRASVLQAAEGQGRTGGSAGRDLRAAFEVHEAELTAPGMYQLTEVSDARSATSAGAALRSQVCRRRKMDDLSQLEGVEGATDEADLDEVGAMAATCARRHLSAVEQSTAASAAVGVTAQRQPLHPKSGSILTSVAAPSASCGVAAVLTCDASASEAPIDPQQVTLSAAQGAAFLQRIGAGTISFAAAQSSSSGLLTLTDLCAWKRFGMSPTAAAELVSQGPADATPETRNRRMRIRAGILVARISNAFASIVVLSVTDKRAGNRAGNDGNAVWWESLSDDPSTLSLRRPPQRVERMLFASLRADLRTEAEHGRLRWRGKQSVPDGYVAQGGTEHVLVDDAECRVVAQRFVHPSPPPLIVLYGPRVNGGCLPVPSTARQALRDGIEQMPDLDAVLAESREMLGRTDPKTAQGGAPSAGNAVISVSSAADAGAVESGAARVPVKTDQLALVVRRFLAERETKDATKDEVSRFVRDNQRFDVKDSQLGTALARVAKYDRSTKRYRVDLSA